MYNFTTNVRATVENVGEDFEVVFPASENMNLTLFSEHYNKLKPYREAEAAKREEMVATGKIQCVYWNGDSWSSWGMSLKLIDRDHIVCASNHLS